MERMMCWKGGKKLSWLTKEVVVHGEPEADGPR